MPQHRTACSRWRNAMSRSAHGFCYLPLAGWFWSGTKIQPVVKLPSVKWEGWPRKGKGLYLRGWGTNAARPPKRGLMMVPHRRHAVPSAYRVTVPEGAGWGPVRARAATRPALGVTRESRRCRPPSLIVDHTRECARLREARRAVGRVTLMLRVMPYLHPARACTLLDAPLSHHTPYLPMHTLSLSLNQTVFEQGMQRKGDTHKYVCIGKKNEGALIILR